MNLQQKKWVLQRETQHSSSRQEEMAETVEKLQTTLASCQVALPLCSQLSPSLHFFVLLVRENAQLCSFVHLFPLPENFV